ncbi:hypothetical protein SHIRM173S_13300 [Streptomyces hirsutus]
MEPRPLAGRTRLLGRARMLTDLADGSVPPLLVHGQTGVGKSVFALRLAAELAAGLPDGQLYVDLDPAGGGRRTRPPSRATCCGRSASPRSRSPTTRRSAWACTGRCCVSGGCSWCSTGCARNSRSASCWWPPRTAGSS